MSSRGDYQFEMRKLREISDRDIERLLSGEALGDVDLDEVASHLRNLRAFSARIPGDEVASRHVAALVGAARNRAHGAVPAGAAPSARPGRGFVYRTKVLAARVAAAAVALSGATAGLAYAGVDLPGQAAEKAFDAVLNVQLPNQGGDEEIESAKASGAGAVADRVHAVIDAWGEAERGCAFGQAVAAAARGEDSPRGPENDPCESEGAEAAAKGSKGSKATGEEKSAAGRAKAEEKSAAGRAKAEEKSSAGKTTGEEKSSAGKATAEEKSSAGRAKGEEKSSEGQSNKPEDTGKP